MAKIDDIVKAIDNKLLETGKEHLILQQASKLLLSLGIIESTKELKQILSEDKTGITVKLRLRITNDFVMELLSRSRSVEVVAPHTLRTRLYDTLRQAAERNKPIETECD